MGARAGSGVVAVSGSPGAGRPPASSQGAQPAKGSGDAPRRLRLLGVEVCPLTVDELNDQIAGAIGSRRRLTIASQNLHGVYVLHRDAKMRRLHEESIPRIDGMALILVARLLGHPVGPAHRVTWVDWIDPLMGRAAEESWRVLYLGGRPGVLERGIRALQERYPGLEISGIAGYFDIDPEGQESQQVLREIDRRRPDLLLVGMGMPRQEHWIVDHREVLSVPAIVTCGAAIDYVAGALPKPPRWMGRIGLEWLFRLASEPGRLWKRYLVEPWFLLGYLTRDIVGRWRCRPRAGSRPPRSPGGDP